MAEMDVLLEQAVKAVKAACKITARVQAEKANAVLKEDRSPVTTADLSAQAVVHHHLERATPTFGYISEEGSEILREAENATLLEDVCGYVSTAVPGLDKDEIFRLLDLAEGADADRVWTLDPVDGTKGFLRGEQYAIALALLQKGEVVLGVMGCPNFQVGARREGTIFYAAKGAGAKRLRLSDASSEPISVSQISDPAETTLALGVESGHHNFDVIDHVMEKLGAQTEAVRMDGQGKYGCIAAGHATAYLRIPHAGSTRKECIWDHAAGALIVEEAGGTVTDLSGKPLNFSLGKTLDDNTGVIATNGTLHQQLVEQVQQSRVELDQE